MSTKLDLADIQGGILRAYGKQGFPKARYIFLTVRDGAKGRALIEALRPQVTTAARWDNAKRGAPLLRTATPRVKDIVRVTGGHDYPGLVHQDKPTVAINLAFTFAGLLALGVPTRTLQGMPDDFIDGMARRAPILGDEPFLDSRDAVWRGSHGPDAVHIMVSYNAEMTADGLPVTELDAATDALEALCAASEGGVAILPGTGPDLARWQDLSAILRPTDQGLAPSNREHFGLADGFGDPVFDGQFPPEAEKLRVIGGGKLTQDQQWAPLATGEFLLGYPDEAQEIPCAAMPITFSRNGTFMAYRKLQENVGVFADYMGDQARRYAAINGLAVEQALELLKAKMVGRWSDGVPLEAAPTFAEWTAFKERLAAATAAQDHKALAAIALSYVNFTYRTDPGATGGANANPVSPVGARCPFTAHMRRANPRDMLDPYYASANKAAWDGSAVINRRRILRRGLPYGPYLPGAAPVGEQGIVFLAVCTSLSRQFEFIQQQWMQYGLDFNAAGDTCPVIGNHLPDSEARFVVTTDPNGSGQPFVCDALPQFVEPKGGDYFFVPSMTALRMIGMGTIDPT